MTGTQTKKTTPKKTTPGHGRRVRIAKGGSPVHIRCACGWISEEFPDRVGAESAHDEHLKSVPTDESGDSTGEPAKAGARKRAAKPRATIQADTSAEDQVGDQARDTDDAGDAKPLPRGRAGTAAKRGDATRPTPRVAPPRGPKSPPKGEVEPVIGHSPALVENPSFLPWHMRCECGWNSTLLKTREEVEVEHAQHLVDVRDEQ